MNAITATENRQTINFECGCFTMFWAEDNACKSAMACCPVHEKPHQTLDQLDKTHDFLIEKKYIPHVIGSIDEQLEQLKEVFPNAALSVPDDNAGRSWQWVSFECPLWGWNKPKTLVSFRISTPGYPFMSPDGGDAYQLFRCEYDLRLSNGGLANRMYPRKTGNEQYTLFGGELGAWNPMYDTLLTYARVCKVALQRMGSGK